MKRLLILLLLLPVVLSFSSLRRGDVDHGRKALTVFIGNYPEDSGWNMIHAGNDRELILGMLHRMGFKSEDIICLEDSEATFRGILSALGRLESMLEKGDEVYVHFSCHGQQITDQDGDEALLNPGDRYDEAIVPYDAYIKYGMNGYKGENHLIDDVLNRHFSSMTDKIGSKGRLLVVNDACHSGGIERGQNADSLPSYRGTTDRFDMPLAGRTSAPKIRPVSWVSISACKDFQTNFEVENGGKLYGRLSLAISRCLTRGMTSKELVSALSAQYKTFPMPAGRTQTIMNYVPEEMEKEVLFH